MNKNILENYKWIPDPRWDNQVLDYDVDRYDWSEWALEIVRELKPTLDSLEHIHVYFPTTELIALRKHLEKWTNSREFSAKLDDFFAEYVEPRIDHAEYLIQATCGIRLVVPDQERLGRLLSFHTGYWTGYSNDMGTVWTPLSRAFGTNSMQVLSWQDSIDVMSKIHQEHLSLDEIQTLCEQHMRPVEIQVGQSWLFNQGHLHGNVNNDTGISRVSFDARYAKKGGDFGPRRAGGFFRFPGQFSIIDIDQVNKNGVWVIFIDQNSQFVGDTPHYMLREMLIGLTERLGIKIGEWSNEYWGCTWMPKLQDFANKATLAGLVMPSVHAFSGPIDKRLEMFRTALENNQQLIFADENLLITTVDDLKLVERIYLV